MNSLLFLTRRASPRTLHLVLFQQEFIPVSGSYPQKGSGSEGIFLPLSILPAKESRGNLPGTT